MAFYGHLYSLTLVPQGSEATSASPSPRYAEPASFVVGLKPTFRSGPGKKGSKAGKSTHQRSLYVSTG